MADLPWFPFYPADWLADERVSAMSYEQRGVYITLLCYAWREGSVPADPATLARLLKLPRRRFDRIWAVVGRCFVPKAAEAADRLVNPRLEEERAWQAAIRDRRAAAARARWTRRRSVAAAGPVAADSASEAHADALLLHSTRNADAMPPHSTSDADAMHLQSTCNADAMHITVTVTDNVPGEGNRYPLPLPSTGEGTSTLPHSAMRNEGLSLPPPAPALSRKRRAGEPRPARAPRYPEAFERFWAAYPRKVEKARAYRVWEARRREGTAAEDLERAARHYAAFCRLTGVPLRYVKHGATFLGPDRPFRDWLAGPPELAVLAGYHPGRGLSAEQLAAMARDAPSEEEEDL